MRSVSTHARCVRSRVRSVTWPVSRTDPPTLAQGGPATDLLAWGHPAPRWDWRNATHDQPRRYAMPMEYKVVELREGLVGGKMSGGKLEKVLNEEASQGWVLKAITAVEVKGRV